MSPWCATDCGDKKIFFANQNFILKIFSFMINVLTTKRIFPNGLFKSNQRQVKISILTPRYVVCLCGVLQNADIVSAVCCKMLRSSLWCPAHCRDWLRGVLHTAEIDSTVCKPPRIFYQHLEPLTLRVQHTVEIKLAACRTPRRTNISTKSKPNLKILNPVDQGPIWVRIRKNWRSKISSSL